ncbi:MAG TPA: LuxR C-terminal-related transcriptional regulator [Polyangiaceae bacterium]|nr:LuxR C-terminal-related transcriptional regulator [Polyangiaceae bacterium]
MPVDQVTDPLDPEALLRTAREALREGDWRAARQAFERALSSSEEPEALEGLASAAWWLQDAACVLETRERAYRAYRKRGDARSAARLAIALAGDFLNFRGEPAVAQGWQQRARELLSECELVPERGWLELAAGDFALSVQGDPRAAASSADSARQISQSLHAEDIRVQAQALSGAALVVEGRIHEGMSQLDGAVTSALAGDVEDPVAIGYSCCYMLQSCERARDFERAGQWCERVRVFSERSRFDALLAICRTHRASLWIGSGRWQEAEGELQAAAQLLAASRPALLGEALLRLAGLRRRQGRLEEAAELLQQLSGDPAALLEQALLAFDRGDARAAVALAERLLRRIPERNQTDRLSVLELLVRAHLELGDGAAAEAALTTWRTLTRGPVRALEAALWRCEGLLARWRGDALTARRALEDAVDELGRCGDPFELARARLELGRELYASGQGALGLGEVQAAVRSFEALGARRELERALDWLARQTSGLAQEQPGSGPEVTRQSPDDAADECGLSPREREVLRLVARGLSNRSIAHELGVSEFTIKRHVQNLLTKLDLPTRAAAASYAVRVGLA